MSKMSMIAKMTVKADKVDEFPAAWDALFAHIDANEPGTEHYVLHQSQTESNVFYMTEVYADQAAFDAHAGSGPMAEVIGSLGDLIEGADMQLLVPVKTARA